MYRYKFLAPVKFEVSEKWTEGGVSKWGSVKHQKIRRRDIRWHTKKIEDILTKFKGLKQIAGIKSDGKRPYIAQMQDNHGKEQSHRQSIADIFATFYEELYKARASTTKTDDKHNDATIDGDCDRRWHNDCEIHKPIPSFTDEELEKAIDQLKNGRASDRKGLTAGIVKAGKEELKSPLQMRDHLSQSALSQATQKGLHNFHKYNLLPSPLLDGLGISSPGVLERPLQDVPLRVHTLF